MPEAGTRTMLTMGARAGGERIPSSRGPAAAEAGTHLLALEERVGTGRWRRRGPAGVGSPPGLLPAGGSDRRAKTREKGTRRREKRDKMLAYSDRLLFD